MNHTCANTKGEKRFMYRVVKAREDSQIAKPETHNVGARASERTVAGVCFASDLAPSPYIKYTIWMSS